ncbi:MAG: copper-binding protein [Thiobacillus sp.]|nr:copper-binding protein [Thiobacillus sp.]
MNRSILLLAACLALPAWASGPAPDWSAATVRKLDAANGRVTLRHGPIPNLDMPPMTMVFRVTPEQLQGLKVGDAVRFRAERADGAFRVIAIEADGAGN